MTMDADVRRLIRAVVGKRRLNALRPRHFERQRTSNQSSDDLRSAAELYPNIAAALRSASEERAPLTRLVDPID
jgi:hypothetical protein